ncbi:unnamed protein product [Caenorhabditis angaria]|uniref:Potassium channel tetramerisation-type BTB domain-containing protein n=1 Tax=Caenorhabditis angaria TaxID=860376 RepID=A0A9P1J3W3_9PELO|nr:unnamed protein product [Caenorhabditis angaria]
MTENLIIRFNVGGKLHATLKTVFPTDSMFHKWFVSRTKSIPFTIDKDGAYFVDRDPKSFGIILNYFRLRKAGQLWEACLPKDPDRLAMLTQESDFFFLPQLRDQAICMLQLCSSKSDSNYINEMLAKSTSCPQGFEAKEEEEDEDY